MLTYILKFISYLSCIINNTCIPDSTNFIYIDTQITYNNINKIIIGLRNKTDNIYFYIDSIGGDFDATYKLINHMEKLKKMNIKFICVAERAFSGAFIIFQYCNTRYVFNNSNLFHHEIYINIKGTISSLDDLLTYYFIILKEKDIKIKKYISNKIEMNYDEYVDRIKQEWNIIGGLNILEYKLADKIIYKNNEL